MVHWHGKIGCNFCSLNFVCSKVNSCLLPRWSYTKMSFLVCNTSLIYIFSLQGMFIPAIKGQGTDEQQQKWLPLAYRMQIIGCYAQTELGHGSNVQGLETTATFDPQTDEFIIHSPTLTSSKVSIMCNEQPDLFRINHISWKSRIGELLLESCLCFFVFPVTIFLSITQWRLLSLYLCICYV